MRFFEKLQVIERVDALIKRKATGTANQLAHRLGVSRSTVFEIFNCMREMGAEIDFCNYSQSYYYTVDKELAIGFVKKDHINGGKMYKNFCSPNFSDCSIITLHQNQNYRFIDDLRAFSEPLK